MFFSLKKARNIPIVNFLLFNSALIIFEEIIITQSRMYCVYRMDIAGIIEGHKRTSKKFSTHVTARRTRTSNFGTFKEAIVRNGHVAVQQWLQWFSSCKWLSADVNLRRLQYE